MTLRLNDEVCPVSLEVLGVVYRAKGLELDDVLDTLSEATRARLAIYLYGRSHTHALGLTIAATCEGSVLRQACPLLGDTVHAASREPIGRSDYGASRVSASRRISLAGSCAHRAAVTG